MGGRQRHEVSSEKTKRRQVFSLEETKRGQFSNFSSKADVPPVKYMLSGLPLKGFLGGWILESLEWVREGVLLAEFSDLIEPRELVGSIGRENVDAMLV